MTESIPLRSGSSASQPGAYSLDAHMEHIGIGNYQIAIFGMASLLVAADGMEMTVISLLRKPLTEEWGLDDLHFSALGSTVFLGLLLGNLTGGYLADTYGRKRCMLGVAAMFCVAGVVSAVAPDIWIFGISRFFCGIGVGSVVPVSDSHLLEWSPAKWRGKLAMSLTGVAFAVGAAFACVAGIVMHDIAGENWWRWMLFICVTPGMISLPLMYLYLPESPHWLVVQGRSAEAEVVLAEAAEMHGKAPFGKVRTEHKALNEGAEWSIKELFQKELLGTTIYCTLTWVACGLIYYGHIFIYPVLLEDIYGMKVDEAYSTILISVLVEISSVIVMMFCMDVEGVGRRGSMALGFLLTWVAASLVPITQDVTQFIALNSAIKGIVEGPFTAIYIYAGELYPSTHRGTAVAVCNSFGRIAAMLAPIILMEAYHVHAWLVYVIFGVAAFVALLGSALFNRETLGKELYMYVDEIQISEEEKSLLEEGRHRVFQHLGLTPKL